MLNIQNGGDDGIWKNVAIDTVVLPEGKRLLSKMKFLKTPTLDIKDLDITGASYLTPLHKSVFDRKKSNVIDSDLDLSNRPGNISDRKKAYMAINESALSDKEKMRKLKQTSRYYDRIELDNINIPKNQDTTSVKNDKTTLTDDSLERRGAGGVLNNPETSNILGGVSNLTTGLNSAVQGYTGTQSAINSGLHSAMQMAGP
jgi:hypothetical protein